jgi:hypothetical protein
MKLTVKELLRCADSGVLAALSAQRLPVVSAFKISRLIRILQPEALAAQAQRNALFTDQNSVQIEGAPPGVRSIKPDCMDDFGSMIGPLLAVEIDIPIDPLTMDDLSGAVLSALEFDALGPLVVA